jgi:serine/threonine protein kinase
MSDPTAGRPRTEVQQTPPADTPPMTAPPPDTGTVAAPAAYAPPDAGGPAGDRYAIGEEIARGGMGAVHLARDAAFDRDVAVKVLLGGDPAGPAARRFFEEARITGQLQHPGIPPVYDLGTLPDGRPFLAMKLIKGKTLDVFAKEAGPGSAALVPAFEKVCEAVGYAHSRG